jgi:benzil reductase ((S)-benzoin forming)
MRIAWITGTSRGLGKALAEQFLDQGWIVNGIGRHHSIAHKNYTALQLDLLDNAALNAFRFEIPAEATSLLLIHNAGIVGEIAYAGNYRNTDAIRDVFQVNLVAAATLSNAFLHVLSDKKVDAGLMFISSGASRNPYDGWSAYCSSKASLDMMARCIAEEQRIAKTNCKVVSVAPGVIDTGMQEQIRQAKFTEFSKVDRFLSLKRDDQLDAPEKTAARLYRIWENRARIHEVCIDLRDAEFD